MNDIRSSLVWKKFEPKKRGSIMEKYKGRFVVHLSGNKKTLYLSDMIIAKLVHPHYIGLASHGSMVGLSVAEKDTGFKVEYKPQTTPSINVPSFIKQLEEDLKHPVEPGIYECEVETIDAQTTDHYNLIIFDTKKAPSKVNGNGSKP